MKKIFCLNSPPALITRLHWLSSRGVVNTAKTEVIRHPSKNAPRIQQLREPPMPSRCYIAVHFRGEVESAFAFFRMLSVGERTFCCTEGAKPGQDGFVYQKEKELVCNGSQGAGQGGFQLCELALLNPQEAVCYSRGR